MAGTGKMEAHMAPDVNILKNMSSLVDKTNANSLAVPNDNNTLSTMMTASSAQTSATDDSNDLVEGWEHDPKKMEIKFASSVLNWKGHLPKRKEDILKIYAFYKQATVGDAPGPEDRPFETNAKEKWEVWNKWRGTPKDVAKRRYITYLRNIDEKLVKVTLSERPPFGFPKEARSKKPICARCNSVSGCFRPLVDGDSKHYQPVPIKNELLDDNADPSLFEYNNLKAWFEHHEDNQQCKWGLHLPITKDHARPFLEWFNRPDVGGFKPYKKQKLIPLLREVLHKQLEILYARQVEYKEKQGGKNKKQLHLAHERLNVQTDRVLGMQYFHKEVTGHEYTFEVPCLRTSKHCNTRRMASSGRNHTHPLEIVRPETDYSFYERAVALRQETVRLGMSASTGRVSSSEERASILAGRIAEFHRRQAGIMEAKLNQLYFDWRHPKQRADVLEYSSVYVKEQLEDAINSGNCEMMATVVSRGAPPDHETKKNMTALMKCTIQCDRKALKTLVDSGADINKFNREGYNALMWACKRDDLIMIHDLLDMGASPGMEGPTGLTACMVAARHDRSYALEVVCDHVLRHDDAKQLAVDRILNHRSMFSGKTALMICAEARMFSMCRTLTALGARTDPVNFKDLTAATLAYHKGFTALGDWLQNTRAIGPQGIKTYSDKTGERKERLCTGNLKKAIESGKVVSGEEGFKLGMKLVGLETNSRATTPSSKSPNSRAGTPKSPPKSRERSPSRGGSRKSLMRGSSPDGHRSRSPDGRRPDALSLIPTDKKNIIDSIIAHNGGGIPEYLQLINTGLAPPDTEETEGMTALIRASMEGNVEVVKLLIKEGADVNYVNRKGQSALMWAAGGCGSLAIGVILLKEGARFEVKDIEGLNAQAYATNAGNDAFGDLIMSARMNGPMEAVRQIENPTITEKAVVTKENNARKTEMLLTKYGATPINADDGDYSSWQWRLPGIVNRENTYEEEPLSSDDTDAEEEKRRNGIGDRGVVKVRCCKCTLFIPCKHYANFNEMWQENPGGVGYKWGLRAKQKRKKKGPKVFNEGFDFREIQQSKNTVEVARKEHEKKMRDAFEKMDVNGDGNLSKMEIKMAICNDEELRDLLELPHMASDEFDELYSRIDLDESMSVTFDEFHTYFMKKKEDLAREQRKRKKEEQYKNSLKAAYKMVDINGDGDVSKTEMLMAIQSNFKIQELLHNKSGGMSEEEFEFMYKKIDKDGSDSIDFEEFSQFFIQKRIEHMDEEEKKELETRKAFNLIDYDHSGTLSRAELLHAMKDNVRIRSLLGIKDADSDDFNKIYNKIDKDKSEEIDFDEFKRYFELKRKHDQQKGKNAKFSIDNSPDEDEDGDEDDGRTMQNQGYKTLQRQKTRRTLKKEEKNKKKPKARHAYFDTLKKKKGRKKGGDEDEYDNGDGEAMDMYGFTGERGEVSVWCDFLPLTTTNEQILTPVTFPPLLRSFAQLLVEDKRIMATRKSSPFVGLNCDFGGKRYRLPRCVSCHVGFARLLLMPENRRLCDRCVLQRFCDTKTFCRLLPVNPALYDAEPKSAAVTGKLTDADLKGIKKAKEKAKTQNEIFVLPDELNLVSFFLGARRYAEAERILTALMERQTIALQNNPANKEDDVAIGFTLRTFAGYEEARGRLPFARAFRENSLDVIAAALGPTHKETLFAIDLYAGSLMKQKFFDEAIDFYKAIITQFEDSKVADRRELAVTMSIKIDNVSERRETEWMELEDELTAKVEDVSKPGYKPVVGGESIEAMEKMLGSDEKWDRIGAKDFRHCCKLLGCFNILRFYLAVKEFKALRAGEAGYVHLCRRIFRDFILEKDMLGYVDGEQRLQIQDIVEQEKRAPPNFMYDELFAVTKHELFEKGWTKFLHMEVGKNWWSDSNMMRSSGPKIIYCQSILRMILAKREINLCGQLEIPMREYYKKKAGDKVLFGQFMAERKRIFGICSELKVSITEYNAKFAELPPNKFEKWVKGRKMKITEAKALRESVGLGKKMEKKRASSIAKKNEAKKVTKGAFEVQFTIHKCTDLKKADMFGKSDPVVVLKYGEVEIGRTSVISKNLNPNWGKWKINSCWVPGELDKKNVPQPSAGEFFLEVYDVDQGVRLGDFLGCWTCITQIACDETENRIFKEDKKLGKRDKGSNNCVGGSVNVSVNCKWVLGATEASKLTFPVTVKDGGEEGAPGSGPKGNKIANAAGSVGSGIKNMSAKMPNIRNPFGKKPPSEEELAPHFNIILDVNKATGLAKADMFGKSDPCARLMWKGSEVDRSHIVSKDLNPVWNYKFKKILIPCQEDGKMADEIKNEEVTIEVYDCDARMLGDFLGRVSFDVSALLARKGDVKVKHSLNQKPDAKKKSKLVKGDVYVSVETEFVAGRSEEDFYEDLRKAEEKKKEEEEKQLLKDLSAGGFSKTDTFNDDYLSD